MVSLATSSSAVWMQLYTAIIIQHSAIIQRNTKDLKAVTVVSLTNKLHKKTTLLQLTNHIDIARSYIGNMAVFTSRRSRHPILLYALPTQPLLRGACVRILPIFLG